MSAHYTKDVDRAAEALRAGALVAIPTETVYGLAANALDERAVARIFEVKERPAFDPLIVHLARADRLSRYARTLPEAAERLADNCWPGPLTLVLPKEAIVPDLVTAGLDTVALRVPDHRLTRNLLERLDFPLAAPSANPFGFVSPTSPRHVADQLGERIELILDGGPCRVGLESTIIGFPAGEPVVYRKGGLAVEAVEEIIGRPIAVREHGNSRPEAPGMLSKHYSPGCRLVLLPAGASWPADLDAALKTAFIGFGEGDGYRTSRAAPTRFDLSPDGSIREAAANLFTTLRELHAGGFDLAYVRLVPERGLGRAINDRLRRAAAS